MYTHKVYHIICTLYRFKLDRLTKIPLVPLNLGTSPFSNVSKPSHSQCGFSSISFGFQSHRKTVKRRVYVYLE